MRPLLLAMFLLIAAAGTAGATGAFDARVATAKALALTRQGFIYDTAMVPAVHHALVPCVPKGRDPGRGGEFVLVGTVSASGRLSHVAVQPATPLARCFAQSFGALTLRPPPKRVGGWPIVVEMQTRR